MSFKEGNNSMEKRGRPRDHNRDLWLWLWLGLGLGMLMEYVTYNEDKRLQIQLNKIPILAII